MSEVVALLDRVEQLTESLHKSRELMSAKEAADFLRLPYSEFRRLLPYLPRHRVTERRYVYHCKELLEWVLTRLRAIAAKISGDQEMLSAYAEGHDLHTLTARSLTGREDISKDDRKLAKALNFGLLYGMGAKGLQSYALKSYGIEMSPEEANLYRRRFFGTYPGLKRWHERERWAWQCGEPETRTLTGRRRTHVERLTDRLNTPVQGTGTDGLKLALALLWERRDESPGAVPVIVCHDEIVVECTAEQAVNVKAWMGRAMTEGMDVVLNDTDEIRVPVEVESRVASSWGEG